MYDQTDREIMESMVRTNLVQFQLWLNVSIEDRWLDWQGSKIRLLKGIPPHNLSNDKENSNDENTELMSDDKIWHRKPEFILPLSITQYRNEYITIECLELIFTKLCYQNTERIILALISDDGTIMFYFMYKGIHKPKNN